MSKFQVGTFSWAYGGLCPPTILEGVSIKIVATNLCERPIKLPHKADNQHPSIAKPGLAQADALQVLTATLLCI